MGRAGLRRGVAGAAVATALTVQMAMYSVVLWRIDWARQAELAAERCEDDGAADPAVSVQASAASEEAEPLLAEKGAPRTAVLWRRGAAVLVAVCVLVAAVAVRCATCCSSDWQHRIAAA